MRNVATWAGNLMLHKLHGFPSDLVTLLVAAGATINYLTLDSAVIGAHPLVCMVLSRRLRRAPSSTCPRSPIWPPRRPLAPAPCMLMTSTLLRIRWAPPASMSVQE